MTENSKVVVDVSSFTVVGMTLMEWLPAIAAIFSIIWTCIRLYETETVKKWLGKK